MSEKVPDSLQLRTTSSTTCLLLGTTLNTLMFFLVRKRTPQYMRQYSRVLAQIAVVDICVLFAYFLAQPVNIAHFTFSNGPFASWPTSFLVLLHFSQGFARDFSNFSVAVPFVYRFFKICRNANITLSTYLLWLIVPGIAAAALDSLHQFNHVRDEEKIAEMLQNLTSSAIQSNNTQLVAFLEWHTLVFIFDKQSEFGQLSSKVALGLNLLYYAIIVLTSAATIYKCRMKEFSITLVLTFQAFFPLFLSALPQILLHISVLMQLYSLAGVTANAGILPYLQNWAPVLYGLFTLLVVKPYRKAIGGALFCKANTVTPMNTY